MTRNNNLNTDAVFSTYIGDVPIFDQWQPYTRSEFTGSVFTAYNTGSLVKKNTDFTAKDSGRVSYYTGVRSRVFDVTSPTEVPRISETLLSDWFTPAKNYAGYNGVYFTVHTDRNEQLWDSCTPAMTSILKIAGTPIYLIGDFDASGHQWAFFQRSYWEGGSGLNVPHIRFFPFEPKYAAASRLSQPETKIVTTKDLNGDPIHELVDGYVVYTTTLVSSGSGGDQTYNVRDSTAYIDGVTLRSTPLSSSAFQSLKISDMQRLHYGIGSGYGCYRIGSILPNDATVHRGDNNEPTPGGAIIDPTATGGGGPVLNFAPVIRGWKYGIVNGLPTYNTARWRRDRFGQFRDMLEQRQYTQFYDTSTDTSTSPVVRVRWVDSDGRNTDPLLTWTSNCSYAATSSLPYYDLESHNRPDIDVTQLNTSNYVSP